MTASPERAAVVTIDGEEVEARFTTNGLCAAEASFGGLSLEAIGRQMAAGGAAFSAVRAIFRAVLVHARPDLTDVQAGRILGDIGTDEAARVIQAAFVAWKAGSTGKAAELPDLDARGRLAFDVGGVRYVLAFAFNAMAEIEPVFPGLTMPEIAAELLNGGVSVSRLRAMWRAALIDHRETSLFEAGEVMDLVGLATVTEAVGKAFVGAFPKVPQVAGDREDDAPAEGNRQARRAAAKATGNPRKPRPPKGGTGKP